VKSLKLGLCHVMLTSVPETAAVNESLNCRSTAPRLQSAAPVSVRHSVMSRDVVARHVIHHNAGENHLAVAVALDEELRMRGGERTRGDEAGRLHVRHVHDL